MTVIDACIHFLGGQGGCQRKEACWIGFIYKIKYIRYIHKTVSVYKSQSPESEPESVKPGKVTI